MSLFLWVLLIALHGLGLFTAMHAVLHKDDPRSALGWAAICLFLPLMGALLYWLFGISRTQSHASRLMQRTALRIFGIPQTAPKALQAGFLCSTPSGAIQHHELPQAVRHLIAPGQRLSERCLVGGNRVVPLYNGEEAYPAMLQAIATAQTRVFMTTYIMDSDAVGDAFVRALCEAAQRGADVRLLLDGVGALGLRAPWNTRLRRMKAAGVHVALFLPPTLVPLRVSINLRTHRKVLVCDNCTAFLGGMNISARHLLANSAEPLQGTSHNGGDGTPSQHAQALCFEGAVWPAKKRVQDMHFACSGPIVEQLRAAFLMDWAFVGGDTPKKSAPYRQESTTCSLEQTIHGGSLCRILMDGPGLDRDVIHDLICSMLATARQHVRIVTPYFLPTPQLFGALVSAILRGVQVDVVLPALNNHKLVDWAMRHQLPLLAERGVRLLLQPAPFAHTKILLVDDVYALVGSANLDPRSLRLNFELVMEVLDKKLNACLATHVDTLIKKATPFYQYPENTIKTLPIRLRNALCWLASPYL